jgi:hypothetical protein
LLAGFFEFGPVLYPGEIRFFGTNNIKQEAHELSSTAEISSSKGFRWSELEVRIAGSNDFWNPIWSEGPYQLGITIVETLMKNHEE